MPVFVRIQSFRNQNEAVEIFSAHLSPRSKDLVSDYDLVDLKQRQVVAQLSSYPRGTECATALLLRLLVSADPGLLTEPFQESILLDVLVGQTIELSYSVELLQITRAGRSASVTLLAPQAVTAGRLVNLEHGASVKTAICVSLLGVFNWGSAPASPPPPLSAVTVHHGAGQSSIVRLADLPALTQRRVRAHFDLAPTHDKIDAEQWLAFIRRLMG